MKETSAALRRRVLRSCLILSAWTLCQVTAETPVAGIGSARSLLAQALPLDDREVRRERRGPVEEFQTQVPPRPYDIVLGNPTGTSVTASILAYSPLEGFFEFGNHPREYTDRTNLVRLEPGRPREVQLEGLAPNTQYFYRWLGRKTPSIPFEPSPEFRFRTGRAGGDPFVFTVQADSHLDLRTDTRLYEASLQDAVSAGPDFHIDLGDTFMTDKRRADYRDALPQFLAQRYYLGLIGTFAPVFLVSGNHDGEGQRRGAMGVWARQQRDLFFSTPSDGQAQRGNYYAWDWGDALFVALDPYWETVRGESRRDSWSQTLGERQYRWLEATLEASRARFKFVFLHHLVGGANRASRGGIAAAPLFEWGGRGPSGAYEFDDRRPGWERPVHRLLVETGVTIVFHGHDHMFAKEDLDGIVYLLVPQPGLDRYGVPRDNLAIYPEAEVVGGPGHVRVNVGRESALVELVQARLDGGVPGTGRVAYEFRVRPRFAGGSQ